MGDFRGLFRGPLVPSQTRCFEGSPGLSGGPGPLVIRPLGIDQQKKTVKVIIIKELLSTNLRMKFSTT